LKSILLIPNGYAIDSFKSLNCATSILQIIREVINPAFNGNGLPEISIRIGLTFGYALVLLYGRSLEKTHIDIIGSSISLASKIVSIAKPNQALVGERIYNIVLSSKSMSKSNFVEIILDPTKWKYLSRSGPDSLYRVYEYTEN
jgi:adenylate cyclase